MTVAEIFACLAQEEYAPLLRLRADRAAIFHGDELGLVFEQGHFRVVECERGRVVDEYFASPDGEEALACFRSLLERRGTFLLSCDRPEGAEEAAELLRQAGIAHWRNDVTTLPDVSPRYRLFVPIGEWARAIRVTGQEVA